MSTDVTGEQRASSHGTAGGRSLLTKYGDFPETP